MSLSVLSEAVMRELKRDAQFDNPQPCLDQDDDVTGVSDPLLLSAGVVLINHRELIAHLLSTEPDWPWHEPPQQKQRTGLNSSPE